MAGTFSFTWGFTLVADGQTRSGGSWPNPVKTVSIGAGYTWSGQYVLPKAASLPVTTPVQVYDYARDGLFEKLIVQVRGGHGYAVLAWLADKPVAPTDLRPQSEVSPFTTTHRRVQQIDLTCDAPWVLNTSLCRVHGTIATAIGLDVNDLPAIMTDGAGEEGRAWRVWASNYAEDADIVLDVWGVR